MRLLQAFADDCTALQDGEMGAAGSEKYRIEEAQRTEKRVSAALGNCNWHCHLSKARQLTASYWLCLVH